MKTKRHPMDYSKKTGLRSRIENSIVEWVEAVIAWYERGLLTRTERDRLIAEGPEAK